MIHLTIFIISFVLVYWEQYMIMMVLPTEVDSLVQNECWVVNSLLS